MRRPLAATRRPWRRACLALVLAAGLVPILPASPAAAFPPYDDAFHTYAEMVEVITAVGARRPDIVRVFSIGRSYEGREIWAAKVSDNVHLDEAEPEVLFDGGHHAGEHMSVEMTIHLLRLLADGHGVDPRITKLVDATEIHLIFNLNPDGTEYDQSAGFYRDTRKNRQPNAGSPHIGTDLNRNYDYLWACCGGSSGDPASHVYRGPAPWSAPEARAIRDFVDGRVVGGIQQLRAHITFHSFGRQILYPYGYTYTDLPADMRHVDYSAFVAMARSMAATNGYHPMQSSDLYITDGDQIDWMYGRHGIFSFTFELSDGYYPSAASIPAEVARNEEAVLYLIDHAVCPYISSGEALAMCEVVPGQRLAGPDRYATAAAVSAARFTSGAPVAYVATGENFPDAMAAGPAAADARGPILLVTRDAIPASTAAELERLEPGEIVVVGSRAVVSDEVEASLAAYTDGDVRRLAGADRYATAAAISADSFAPGAPVAYVATGSDFPDGLAAVAPAGRDGGPVLLTGPTAVPPATRAELDRLDPDRIVVVGGPAVVADAVLAELRAYAPDVTRLSGADRYATAAAISAANYSPGAPVAYLATGRNFPDALAGGAAAALVGGPILLLSDATIPGATSAELRRLQPNRIVLLGSGGLIPEITFSGLRAFAAN